MRRREFFPAALLGGLAILVRSRRSLAQGVSPPPQRPDSSDRLYDPSVVQSRGVATAADNEPGIKALEHRLKCTCGCNLDIYTCRTTDFTCSYSPALHQEVLALQREGKTAEAIVAAFVAKYGEQILMAPKPEGFNLAGYLVPGALILTVAALLGAVLLRRGRPDPAPTPGSSPEPGPASAAEDEQLRRALAEVED